MRLAGLAAKSPLSHPIMELVNNPGDEVWFAFPYLPLVTGQARFQAAAGDQRFFSCIFCFTLVFISSFFSW